MLLAILAYNYKQVSPKQINLPINYIGILVHLYNDRYFIIDMIGTKTMVVSVKVMAVVKIISKVAVIMVAVRARGSWVVVAMLDIP